MELEHSLYDERFVPNGRHENLDIVNIPSKSMWFHCSRIGNFNRAPLGHVHMVGAHMGGDNFSFIDGHAQTYKVEPIKEYWRATGGSKAGSRGLPAYTYPPTLNVAGKVHEAEWWVPPTYPDGPINNTPE